MVAINTAGMRTGDSTRPNSRWISSRLRSMSLRSSLLASRKGHRTGRDIELSSVGSTAASGEPRTPQYPCRTNVESTKDETGTASPPFFDIKGNGKRWSFQKQRNQMGMYYERARRFILDIPDIPPTKDGRHIPLSPSREEPLIDERIGKPYISNLIRSSKYTPWNFLPRQLFVQFSKLANCYFLIVSILQMIPGLSTTGMYTTIAPLLFFVSLSIAKEGHEDLRRHRLDRAENNRKVQILEKNGSGTVGWTSIKWKALQVGDIVRLHRDEAVPADVVLLSSKGANNTVYIETMAVRIDEGLLDGETNLKPKQPSPTTVQAAKSAETLAASTMHFVVEDPNTDLYSWDARVTIDGQTSPLTNNEIIYRGSIIRNTHECYAMVVYTGEESKIRMNSNKHPRIKVAYLERAVNRVVIGMACFVLFLSCFNTVAYTIWQNSTEEDSWYIADAPVSLGPLWTSFFIMFSNVLPLSLYISLEIVKLAQMILMDSDTDMYDPESDTPFEAHTSSINEELGQVGYIFSDKTGTLTENVMKFRKMSIAGIAYLHDVDLQIDEPGDKEAHKGKTKVDNESSFRLSKVSTWQSFAKPAGSQKERNTRELIEYLRWSPHTPLAQHAKMMVLSMAICHTCLPERSDSGNDDEITFQASSPDELALVEAARELGYLAYERDGPILTLKTYPQGPGTSAVVENYEILHVIEFSSQRKRMSVVVRLPTGRVVVFCKGADSVIMARLRLAAIADQALARIEQETQERRSMGAELDLGRQASLAEYADYPLSTPPLARPQSPRRSGSNDWNRHTGHDSFETPQTSPHSQPSTSTPDSSPLDESLIIERCMRHVDDFATEGLRTLLYGYRFLEEEEYQRWAKIYQDATTSLVDRTAQIEQAGELIEQNLELAGATAIEDKLQEGVPETIDRLRRAYIKMWMLTGDKRETAITIGYSCRLIKDFSKLVILDSVAGDIGELITVTTSAIVAGGVAHSVIVIDGQTLSTIGADEALHALFLELAILADSVICCRASPSQKSSLVKAIRTKVKGSVTLAIGDGANDIAMIQEAQVGIGLTGKEGHQAARVSDYSIARFRFLAKLLLVHGRWNYVRTCKYVVGTFWKEIVFYITQFLYQHNNGFSATSLYESWSMSLFNALFTSLPIIFLGAFEKDLSASTLLAIPELYSKGQRSQGFNWKVFFGWMFTALCQAFLIFFTAEQLWAVENNFTKDNTIYPIGVMTYTATVVIISVKLQIIEQRYKSIAALVAVVVSVGAWWLWNIAIAGLYSDDFRYAVKDGLFDRWGQDGLWWLTLLVIVLASCVFELGIRAIKAEIWPTEVETFQTLEKNPDMRSRFEEASAPWLPTELSQ